VYNDDPSSIHYGENVSGSNVSYTYNLPLLAESITYENPRFEYFGNCTHSRTALELLKSPKEERYTLADGSKRKRGRSAYFLAALFHNQVETAPTVVFQNDDWSGWSVEALESCLPTFSEGGESLVNDLLELKQTFELLTPWLAFGKRFSRSFFRSIRKDSTVRAAFVRGLRATHKAGFYSAKSLANFHLNIKFGWAPFLSDVERVRSSLKNFQKKLRDLQKNSNIPQRRHYKRYLDMSVLPPKVTLYSDAQQSVSRETYWRQRPVYNATVDFVYTLPDMSSVSSKVAGYLDSLGFQLNPRILWDAIPYSFVVDWFFDVGSWLGSLRTDNLKVPATVTGFCHSLKWEYESQYLYNRPATTNPPWSSDQDVIVARRRVLRYERRRDVPSWGLFSTTVRIPNWGQVALGASLVIQKS